jgi:hypothetical protein
VFDILWDLDPNERKKVEFDAKKLKDELSSLKSSISKCFLNF